MSYGFKVLVEGDYACFTRPELKVERVSYDVPTPGALEGMLKSVYWKPAVRYVIDKIIVFHPIDFINIRRNEVKEKVKFKAVKNQMKGKAESPCIYTSKIRSQRASMVLKNVKYGIALKSVYLIATRDLSNLWLQFFLSQNQGFMRLFEKTVLK